MITGLSLHEGHKGGGYDLTITGRNFPTIISSTQVFIGDAMNSICKISTIPDSNTIICTIPQMMDSYEVDETLQVLVAGRILE